MRSFGTVSAPGDGFWLRSLGSSPGTPARGYRQNCRCHSDRTVSVTALSMPAGSDIGSDRRRRRVFGVLAGLLRCRRPAGGAAARLEFVLVSDGARGVCVLPVGEVVAQAGPAPPCPAGDAGFVGGDEFPPGADLADVGGG